MLFIVILIIILALVQVIFVDQIYQYAKTQQTIDVTHTIASNLSSDKLEENLDALSEHSDYCVRILDLNNKEYYVNSENSSVCGYIVSDTRELAEMYVRAIENDGVGILISEEQYAYPTSNLFNNKYSTAEAYKSITVAEIGYMGGNEFLLLVSSKVSVVGELKRVFISQLFIVSAILVVISSFLAYFMAKKISSPIIKINNSAKQLALGNFDTVFEGTGYLEIEELNDTLNYAKNNLARVEKLRNEFVANMSHDLRTPLTMISGYAEMMKDIPGENKPENIQVIIDECARLNGLINDSLTLSKLQTNNDPLQIDAFNLTLTIQDIVTRVTTLLHDDSYMITFVYDQEVWVEADSVKINQVVYNLLLNAIHYSGINKTIVVKQEVIGNNVRIEVIDSGKGIKEEDIDKVFNRYYQSRNRCNNKGSGLGLSIVKSVLELHKSDYGVTSIVNEGTTFYFALEKIKE